MITEYIRKILGPIPNWIITVVSAIVPTFFIDKPFWAVVIFIGAIACSSYINHVLLSEPIDLKSDYSTKKQFEVFDLLSKLQKRRIKSYFYFSIWSLLCIPLWFSMIMYYHGKKIFESFDIGGRYIIFTFLTTLIAYSSYFVWRVYTCSINFYDSNIPQILWGYIEKLIEQHGSKKGELNEVLDKEGEKQLLYVLEKRKDGKIPTNLSKSEFEKVLEAEVAIIEILTKKSDSDIEKKIYKTLEKISDSCRIKIIKRHILDFIKYERTKTKKL